MKSEFFILDSYLIKLDLFKKTPTRGARASWDCNQNTQYQRVVKGYILVWPPTLWQQVKICTYWKSETVFVCHKVLLYLNYYTNIMVFMIIWQRSNPFFTCIMFTGYVSIHVNNLLMGKLYSHLEIFFSLFDTLQQKWTT